jgi:hypothetical protein
MPELLEDRRLLATLTVNTASDTVGPNDPTLSLREAIEVSNGTLAISALSQQAQAQIEGTLATPNTIDFDIPGTGVQTITLESNLPSISSPATIDGYSQPGAHPNTNGPRQADNAVPLIQLADGTFAANNTLDGLTITGGNTTVRGLVIDNRFEVAIDLQGDGNTVAGDFLGTTADGLSLGIHEAIFDGVKLEGSNNTIGGTLAADRNVISGWEYGVFEPNTILNAGTGNVFQGNLIGLDATGATGLFNTIGIELDAGGSATIGGTAAGAGNVVTGNGNGIMIQLTPAIPGTGVGNGGGDLIEGNLIGTDVTGTLAIQTPDLTNGGAHFPGNADGVTVTSGAPGRSDAQACTIGGTTAASGNVISGNVIGVGVGSEPVGTVVEGNLIGVDINGSKALANVLGINATGPGNTIGGTVAGAGNTIAFNSDPTSAFPQDPSSGVFLMPAAAGTPVLGNSIYGNANGGFVTEVAGRPAPPVLSSVSSTNGGKTLIGGTFQGTPSSTFRIEFFASATADPSGSGQGQTYLGFAKVNTGPDGKATFSAPVAALPQGELVVSATATDSNNNTSSFAKNFTASATSSPTNTRLVVPTSPVTAGQTVTLVAIVSAQNGGVPPGSVVFTVDGVSQPAVALAVSNGHGQATLSETSLQVGTHHVTASYSGNSGFQPSASPDEDFQVVSVSRTPTSTRLILPLNPVTLGQSVTLVAIVSASNRGVPAGSVVFTIDGVAQPAVPLAVSNGQDQATLPEASLLAGTHHVTASYGGNSAFQPSASPDQAFQIVGGSDGPRATKVERFGIHMMPTTVVVSFDEALDAATAQAVENYSIVGPGGRRIAVSSATYNAATATVTLHPAQRISIHHSYKLVINGTGPSGVRDMSGRLLDGAGTGHPDSNYVTTLTWRNLVLPAFYSPRKF